MRPVWHTMTSAVSSCTVKAAIGEVNAAIDSGDMERLYAALRAADARFTGVDQANMRWYMDVLTKAKKDKLESSGCSDLEHNEIQDILTIANSVAEHTRLGTSLGGGANTLFTLQQIVHIIWVQCGRCSSGERCELYCRVQAWTTSMRWSERFSYGICQRWCVNGRHCRWW